MRIAILDFVSQVILIVIIPVELRAQTDAAPPATALKIVHFGVGNGDATLITVDDGSPDHKTLLSVLIDGGSRSMAARVVIPGIRYQKIEALDYAISTHYDRDHSEGLSAVLQSIPMTGTGLPMTENTDALSRGGPATEARHVHPE